ncbi:hypothetical protein ABZ464_13690 [Streptomyces sp. NPDC005820]|uniref:hypothetical protein n=1 Tax=Streptomyces sp. NPDC005820 TaxID=3157069 RepID=UPI0033C6CC4C
MTSTQSTVSAQADDTGARRIPGPGDRIEAAGVRPALVTIVSDESPGVCTVDGECS